MFHALVKRGGGGKLGGGEDESKSSRPINPLAGGGIAAAAALKRGGIRLIHHLTKQILIDSHYADAYDDDDAALTDIVDLIYYAFVLNVIFHETRIDLVVVVCWIKSHATNVSQCGSFSNWFGG